MNKIDHLYTLAGLNTASPRHLSGSYFEGQNLDSVLLGPGDPPNALVSMEDSVFSKCKIKGEFRVAPGVMLKNVLFDNVWSSDGLTVSTQAVLDQVVVKGGRGGSGLWIKPSEFVEAQIRDRYEQWAHEASQSVEWMIDFSELDGNEVEVVGLPASKLRWNMDRHILIESQWTKSEAWKALDLPITSFWRMRLKRLELFGAAEGVYSIPNQSDKKYAQFKDEMSRLIAAGLLRQ